MRSVSTLISGAVMLTGCAAMAPAGTNPAPVPGPSAEEAQPYLVAPSRAPGAAPTARPSATPAAPRASATPRPTPTPAPAWATRETASYYFRFPETWTAGPGEAPLLTLAGTTGAFQLIATETTSTLAQLQEAARVAAGPGLIRVEASTLDGLRGYMVTALVDRPDGGKRRVTTRGYVFRGRHWQLVASWDPRDQRAGDVEEAIAAILATFRWL